MVRYINHNGAPFDYNRIKIKALTALMTSLNSYQFTNYQIRYAN